MRARTLASLWFAALGHVAAGQIFTNPAPINIPDQGAAAPFPSVIHVSGMGQASDVSVVLNGATHTYMADLDILLVGPNGIGVYIISDAGAYAALTGGDYGFAMGGAPIPTVGNPAPNGVYAPTFTTGDDSFPGVSYTLGASLYTFNGIDPNGDWKLYVVDDAAGDQGVFAGGWSLVFDSLPPGNSPSTFTYQGRLDGATGPVDMRFQMHKTKWFPSSVSAVDSQYALSNIVPDEHGVFTVEVPYNPDLMDGTARFEEIAVSPAGELDYTTLAPRQPILRTPLASWANRAKNVNWSGILNIPSGFQDGVDDTGPWTIASGNDYVETNHDSVRMTTRLGANIATESFSALHLSSTSATGTAINLAATGTFSNAKIEFTGPSHYGGGSLFVLSNAQIGNGVLQGLAITSTGLVGVNTYSPTFTLTVAGTAGKPGGGSWAVFSDARLKHDITPLTGTLDKLLNVHGVSYFYNEPEKIGELKGRHTGVVAQEVEKVFPEWVDEGASGYKSVTFRGFEALTIEALRDLRAEKDAAAARADARIDQLTKESESRAAALAAENAELRARIERLEAAQSHEER